MNLSGRVLADYAPGVTAPETAPLPRGGSSGVPLRDRHHPGVGEVRGTSSAMRHTPVAASSVLPFEISVTEDSLIAAGGIIDVDTHAEEINTTMTSGTWYFRAKVTIDNATGAITATDVLWSTTEAASTSTDFYLTIARVDVTSGTPDPATILQFTYGPLLVVLHGAPADVWAARIF